MSKKDEIQSSTFSREEVIDFYNHINDTRIATEFAMRWTVEYQGKEWRDEYVALLNPNILMSCLFELFAEHHIVIVEEIETGRILKIY